MHHYFSSQDDDESVDESTFAVNRNEPADDETGFGSWPETDIEEQKLRMEARIKELEEKGTVHTVVEFHAHEGKTNEF